MVLTRSQSRVAVEDDQSDRDRDYDSPAVGSPRGDSHSPGPLMPSTGQDEYGSSTRTGRDPLPSVDTAPRESLLGDTTPYDMPGPSAH